MTAQGAARAAASSAWHAMPLMLGFCAMYGLLLSRSYASGWTLPSAPEYLAGVLAAALIFLPAWIAGALALHCAPGRTPARNFATALAVAVGVLAGLASMHAIQPQLPVVLAPGAHVASALPLVLIGWLGLAVHLFRERERDAAQALHDERAREAELRRRACEAELQVLQSQVEPHFLFNCLSHVRRLHEVDPAAGRDMLRHLRQYIGSALPAMRERCITLDRELELAVAYLEIQQVRMGARLRFSVEASSRARAAQIPPWLVSTLVENAIKHGLSPLTQGGSVSITARCHEQLLIVEVTDTGRGLQHTLGRGIGIANVKARLTMLHGSSATLTIRTNETGGVTATAMLPLRMHPPAT